MNLHMEQNGSFSVLSFAYEELGRIVRELFILEVPFDASSWLSKNMKNKYSVLTRHFTPANNGWLLLAQFLYCSLILLS